MASFWKPYNSDCEDQEHALDLSRPAVKVKPVSTLQPLSAPTLPTSVPEMYPGYIAYPDAVYPEASYYRAGNTPVKYAASTISPVSNDSGHCTEDCDTESLSNDREYQIFEEDAMRAMAAKNGGSLLGHNPRMKRAVQSSQSIDDSYKKQRERNNIAAKASRDRRKLREMKLALQTTYLKKKVAELQARLAAGLCRRCRQRCDC
ncbi:hypothetical protein SFRURICE_013267 [Spodoptera frugiperda]|uniref:SFRICE_035828 n=1 Tax=Spodoptera frugiperda TaxID=7108 RepID=A0A2H1V079_SPOFR|nr:hypothetical protein SFRURICE_013267 [Spodoptera frugiperda]